MPCVNDKNISAIDFEKHQHKGHFSFGQDLEIDETVKHLKDTVTTSYVVLFGLSQGATTILTYLSLYGDTFVNKDGKKVQIIGAVVESPFARINYVDVSLLKMLPRFAQDWSLETLSQGKFKRKGIHPLKIMEKIPKNIPLLFIHSKEDALIPIRHSRLLYRLLRPISNKEDAVHDKVHLLELNYGRHAGYIFGGDKEEYRNTSHAFYKTYGIPHNKDFAENGKKKIH